MARTEITTTGRITVTRVVKTFKLGDGSFADNLDVEIGDIFECPCGNLLACTDPWLAAHCSEELTTDCKKCGQKYDLEDGQVVRNVSHGMKPLPTIESGAGVASLVAGRPGKAPPAGCQSPV